MSMRSWLRRIGRRRLDEDDFQDEIRAHLAIAAREKMADGADPRSAELSSKKDFGNIALTTDAARRVWLPRWLEWLGDLTADVRYACRTLAKRPGFSLTVVAVLTLGIGLNATVFTMLKSQAFTPLAGVDDSAGLVVTFRQTTSGRQLRMSYPDYAYLRDHDRAFAELMGSSLVTVGLGRGRDSRPIWGELVTGNYFHVLGVRAELGRTILASDETAPGRHPVVVISDGLWRRDFGADPAIVGKTVELNRYPLTVVGVADSTFHGTIVSYDVEVFIPVMMAAQMGVEGGLPRGTSGDVVTNRRAALLFPHGYLRPGISLARAGAETNALWSEISRDRPIADAAEQLRVVPFRDSPTGGQTYLLPTVVVLSAMGVLVLLIACANIAGLVLVRGLSRRGEIAVRLALGATRRRVVRLLVVENLVLALPGAALGILLASRAIPFLVHAADLMAAPQRLFFNIAVDRFVIAFAVLAACGSALVFGFVPALQSARVELVSAINEDASPRGASRGRLRTGLVVAQVAVSLVLLAGAALVVRSFRAAQHADPGFDANQTSATLVDVWANRYDEARGRAFYRKLLDAVRADGGVESASLAEYNPMNLLETPAARVSIDGYEPRRGEELAFMTNAVAPGYFRTLRIPLDAGRVFADRDDEQAAPVAIVNETLARRFWGGADGAIGKRIRVGADGAWRTVVGVAADVKYLRINESPRPYIYLPFLQSYHSSMILYTHGPAPVDSLLTEARAHIAALDPDLPVVWSRPLAERVANSLVFMNLTAAALFVFGAAGMVLAALGTYGLVSYTVRQSTHEIGIRMALGASAASVIRAFLVRGLRLGAVGAAGGLAAALGATRLLRGVLFGVTPTDPVSFATALAIVLGGVALATLVPAWRAARVDPMRALRHQ
jgi:predicted permease